MPRYVAKGGKVTFATNLVGNLMGWSVESSAEPISQKDLLDEWETFSTTASDHPKSWTATVSVQFDEADTAIAAMDVVGVEGAFEFQARGATTGFPEFQGNGIVTGVNRSGELGGLLVAEFTVTGNGALVEGTVA